MIATVTFKDRDIKIITTLIISALLITLLDIFTGGK